MQSIAKKIVNTLRNEDLTIQKARIILEIAIKMLEQEPLTKNVTAQSKCAATEGKD